MESVDGPDDVDVVGRAVRGGDADEAAAEQHNDVAVSPAQPRREEEEPLPHVLPAAPAPVPPAPLALEVVAQAGGGAEAAQQDDEAEAAAVAIVDFAGAIPPAAQFAAAGPVLPHQAAVVPPARLLRRASVSSLDECSQRGLNQRGGQLLSPSSSSPSSAAGGFRVTPSYRNPSHPQRSLEGLRTLRRAGHFTDVTLVAGDVEVRAHKNVLAASSPYFCAMFTEFEESRRDRVVLGEIDPDALVTLVEYIYTAEVDVTEDNVQTLLTAANLLQLDDVRDGCCEFLQSQLHPTNCLGIKTFADMHGCSDLHDQTVQFIETRFTDVLKGEEFLLLEAGQVEELISSDTISVPSEEKVYESVLAWVAHDPDSRRQHLARLMSRVRLPLMPKDYLLQRVDGEGMFDAEPRCKDFVIEALKYHLAHGDPTKLAAFKDSERVRPRLPVGLPKVMLAIGGQAPKAIASVECYDFKEEKWFAATDMNTRRCRCGVAVVRGKVYAVGGFNGSLRVKTVDEYDPTRDAWNPVANMEARRSTLGVAVLNDHIYAVGGFDGSTGLNSAEVLDLSQPDGILGMPAAAGASVCVTAGAAGGAAAIPPSVARMREWRPIANMSTRRSSVGVGVLGGLIYAVGGYDGNSRHCLSSVEVYSPEQDVWKPVADMSARRSGAGVGVLGGCLYSVGGHDGPLVRKSVECYNPEDNAWSSVADMNFCRRNAGVVTHGGLLYVVGGDDGTSNLQSVEAYNPKTDTWSLLPGAMTTGRSYTGVAIIDKPDAF